ncbi:Nn.00g088060.m01.CDS01 [Neocucurbitaria sp. VM-36]
MQDTGAQDSLRRILARSSPRSPEVTASRIPKSVEHRISTPAVPLTNFRSIPVLQYPTVNVLGSSRHTRKHRHKVSCAGQSTNANTSEQVEHGPESVGQQQGSTDSGPSSETLTLDSPFYSDPPSPLLESAPARVPTQSQPAYPSRPLQHRQMSPTRRTARNLSPVKDNIWDPDDSEWADVDADKVYSTFQASYKTPAPHAFQKSNALTRVGTSLQESLSSLLPISLVTKRVDDKLREEEKRRDQLEELRNTYHCDPEGDLADEIMQQVFLTGSRFFPSQWAISPRRMHIIHLDAYFTTRDALLQEAKPRLRDAVATVLSHTSQQCLKAFLDPRVEEFAYRREVDRNKAGLTLLVRRKGNEVIAGAYRNFGFMMQWTLYVRSLVSITGEWHEVYASLKPGLTPIVDGVPQWGTFESDGVRPEVQTEGSRPKIELSSPKETEHDDFSPTNPKFMLYQSRILAKYLLWDIWVRFDGLCECKAIWEADGEENEVRLKRALVSARDTEEGEQ